MDFSQFQAVDVANERKARVGGTGPRVQGYEGIKYTRGMRKTKEGKELGIEGRFFISNKLWSIADLQNLGLKQFAGPNGVPALGAVADDKAVMFKKSKKSKEGKKSKMAKWTILEKALHDAKVIDMNLLDANQFINVSLAGENVTAGGIAVSKIFTLSKGEVKAKEPAVKKKAATVTNTVVDATPTVSTPTPAVEAPSATAQPTPQVEPAAKSDWD